MAFARLARSQSPLPATAARSPRAPASFTRAGLTGGVVQRKCGCGGGSGCSACSGKGEELQTKLQVSEPGDAFEREADRVADRVMAPPADPGVSASPVHVQRFTSRSNGAGEDTPTSVGETVATPGRPMDTPLRHEMEQRFGHEFGGVRLHMDRRAADSAADIGARAYTFGQHIVFGHGAFDSASGAGRTLLAHELAHTIQQRQGSREAHAPLTASGQTVARQPDDEPRREPQRICVPGAPADSPACLEWEERKKQLELERNTPVARDAGLGVPVHPDAVSGVHEWSTVYGTPGAALNKNNFDVGNFRVMQICAFDAAGEARVYVYYAYDTTDDDDKYAVGPDSLKTFVADHGGTIVARPGNRDDLSTGKKTVDARKLPAAPDALPDEPTMYYTAPALPAYDERGDAFSLGKYLMVPYLRRLPNGDMTVLYWIAENVLSKFRKEYVFGPRWLDIFTERQGGFALMAELSYPLEPGAEPPAYAVHSARYIQGIAHGDPERAKSGLEAWKSAAKDPGWWFQVFMGYAGAAQPAPARTPTLTIAPKGGGAAPSIAPTTVTTTVSPAPVVSVGGRGAAVAARVAPAPVVTPAVPRPGPVGVPGWNPNPVPIAPVTPPSSVATALASGAAASLSSQLATSPAPSPAPQPEPQPEERRCPYATGLTPADPIPMRWFKPRHDSFYQPTLALNGGTLERDDANTALPDGTRVGVQERFWPRLGKVMQLWPGFRTGAEGQFRRLLARWGYQWGPTEQCDHVQDPQWCGPDEVYGGNFWPLETSTNQSAGPTQNNNQLVTFCPSPTGLPAVDWRVQDMKNAGYYGRYFTIQEVLLVSNRAPGLTRVWYPAAGRPTCHDGRDQ